jgi:hypothetical protein
MTPLAVKCATPECRQHTTMGLCPDCQNGKGVYNQDHDRAQDRNEVSLPPREGVNGLGLGSRGQVSELEELRAAYHAGTLQPVAVRLGPIPKHFGPVQRAVADDLALLMGLRLAEGEERPLPYPASAAVSAGLAGDKIQASRILRRLVNAGVVDHVDTLKKFKSRDGRLLDGTRCYAPPAGRAA